MGYDRILGDFAPRDEVANRPLGRCIGFGVAEFAVQRRELRPAFAPQAQILGHSPEPRLAWPKQDLLLRAEAPAALHQTRGKQRLAAARGSRQEKTLVRPA